MSLLQEILSHNEKFVAAKDYEKYATSKFPDKRLIIVTCMDTRLMELLPKAMNLRNGDVKLLRNAGAMISDPFGSMMSSILVALYELQADEVCIVAHHGCGMSSVNPSAMMGHMLERGVTQETLDLLEHSGHDLHKFLSGFDSVEKNVRQSVAVVKNHPLLPAGTPVHGLIIDPETGKLDLIIDGYKA